VNQHWAAVVVICCPWTSFTIQNWRSFGQEEEDKDNDGNGLQERDNYKGMMTTTNDCSGHGRRNAKGRWNRKIVAFGWRWQWHHGKSHWLPPPGLLLADIICGRRDAAWKLYHLSAMLSMTTTMVQMTTVQMIVPPLINNRCNASFRQTDAMRIHAF
jgi:hypothetical protein